VFVIGVEDGDIMDVVMESLCWRRGFRGRGAGGKGNNDSNQKILKLSIHFCPW
jgi:hypothetical protein